MFFKAFSPRIYGFFFFFTLDIVFMLSSTDQDILILMNYSLLNVYFMDHCFYNGNSDRFSLLGL